MGWGGMITAQPGNAGGQTPRKAPTPGVVPWHHENGVLTLRLRVQPGAARSEWAGMHGDALRLRIAAPPVDGKANKAVLRFVAQWAGVPVRSVALLRGEASRDKTLRVTGLEPHQIQALTAQWGE